jgi:dihydroneopterin aldolase
MGIVGLKGVEVLAKIGVLPQERVVGRKFLVDVEISTSLKAASETDDPKNILNYKYIADAVYSTLSKEYQLIETAARAVGEDILIKYPNIKEMKIRIYKTKPFLQGSIYAAFVEWHYPTDY